MRIIQYPSASVAQEIARLIVECLRGKDRPSLVLAGGSTFGPVYELLAAAYMEEIPWNEVSVYFGDERCVAADDPRSNYKFAYDRWLGAFAEGMGPQVFRMQGELDPGVAAAQYEASLPESFDAVLLGVGEDGHIASVFPGSLEDIVPGQLVVATAAEREPLVPRVTLTPEALNRGESILVAATGQNKKEVVRDIALGLRPDYPVARIREDAVLFVDGQAAILL